MYIIFHFSQQKFLFFSNIDINQEIFDEFAFIREELLCLLQFESFRIYQEESISQAFFGEERDIFVSTTTGTGKGLIPLCLALAYAHKLVNKSGNRINSGGVLWILPTILSIIDISTDLKERYPSLVIATLTVTKGIFTHIFCMYIYVHI
jgi:superfamily II DNA/RNA helicase